jgi:hypothetical protein
MTFGSGVGSTSQWFPCLFVHLLVKSWPELSPFLLKAAVMRASPQPLSGGLQDLPRLTG